MSAQNVKTMYLLIIVIILGFYTLSFLQLGMFFDGVTYAAISHNFSLGIGSIKEPVFFIHPSNLNTDGLFSDIFYEHPTLVF